LKSTSGQYEKCGAKEAITKSTLFSVSKDEWNAKEEVPKECIVRTVKPVYCRHLWATIPDIIKQVAALGRSLST